MLKSKLIKLIFFLKERGKASLYWCDWFLDAHLPCYLCTGTMPVLCLLCLYYAYYAYYPYL